MNKYESLTIFSAALNEEELTNIIKKYTDIVVAEKGNVLNVNKWGIKKFAYSIDYKKEGHYVLVEFESTPEVPAKLTHLMNIDESVFRTLILRKDA